MHAHAESQEPAGPEGNSTDTARGCQNGLEMGSQRQGVHADPSRALQGSEGLCQARSEGIGEAKTREGRSQAAAVHTWSKAGVRVLPSLMQELGCEP